MRVRLEQDGGFVFMPGLHTVKEVNTKTLPPKIAKTLKRLVTKADFFSLPTKQPEVAKGAADYRTYTITIEDDGKRHSVETPEITENEALRDLIEFVEKSATA
ncbi:MAG: hypothetical protein KF716_24775 [Anaerolineae bacterium]|nr:hypothetical protein [Anaerolineae bacterium]